MNNRAGLLLLSFLFFFASLPAQQLITSYSVGDGLPQSTVTSLYRDNDGYLWCGTGVGLCVYDGWDFLTPQLSKEKHNNALDSPVRAIIPSSDQKTVWVGTETACCQFDRFNFHLLRSFDIVKEPGIGEVPVFANDTAVWVICWTQGLYRVRINDGKSTRLTNQSFGGIPGMDPDGQTVYFADTTGHITLYNIVANKSTQVAVPFDVHTVAVNQFRSIPGTDDVLVLTSRGAWKLDKQKKTVSRYSFGDPSFADSTLDFHCMDIDPDGSWWLGVLDHGIYRYDQQQHRMRSCRWQQDGSDAFKLQSAPTSIVCDQYGVVWCGTDGNGLLKLLHNRMVFSDKYTDPLVTDTCNWFTRCFYELSPGRYLVGVFRNGLKLVDHNAGTIRSLSAGAIWNSVTPLFITGTGEGHLLVGTDESILLLDTVSWTTTVTDAPIGTHYVGCLRLRSGKLLVYGNNGINFINKSPAVSLGPQLIRNKNITNAIQLRDGRVLASTYYDGIIELDSTGEFIRIHPYDSEIGLPNTTNIHAMYEDESGQIWLATENGLRLLNVGLRLVTSYSTTEGISDKTIYDLIVLNNQQLLLTTGHGITLFNMQDHSTKKWYGSDGLPSEECNSGALLHAPSGMVYVGTTTGYIRWNPDHTTNCYRAPVILASYGSADQGSGGIIREQIVRNYGSGPVDVSIWITDFAFSNRAVYTRQLEGSENIATTETGLRKVTYSALGSGFYSFLCSVQVPGCETTALTKLFTIKIVPPFWMSGWFIGVTSMGVVVIITLILFVIMRLNYQRKIRKLKMQQELDKVRQRISRDIHDEIGAGLTRIALSGELLSQKTDVSPDKLKWIAGTARELSQSMKEVVWSVNPHYDSLDHMTAYFRSYAAGVAENADVRFVFMSDENIPAEQVNPETRRNLLLILKEAITNSAKYSGCSELKLEIRWSDRTFRMTISDDGKGFDLESSAGVNSNGLRNIRQRAEMSGCIVEISSSAGKGTTISVHGPIDHK